jgi:membrane-associated phospholipid phosphatase
MRQFAHMLRAVAVVVGLAHGQAGELGAQDPFDEADAAQRTANREEFPPPALLCPLDEPCPDASPRLSYERPAASALDARTASDEPTDPDSPLRRWLRLETSCLWADFDNYYCGWPTYRNLAIAFGVGAALANTSADEHFQNWYQAHVRTDATDHASSFFRAFGIGAIFIPAWAGVGFVGAYFDESPCGNVAAELGFQTTRAYLVGSPAVLFAQYLTGGSRPGERPDASHWRPFQDSNGVSGHAFIGAVPFLTAARMVESPWLKGLLYFGSTLPGWSRIDDNKHFLSQVLLGWSMAYIACDAVDRTERTVTNVLVTPVVTDQMAGIGIVMLF